MSIVIEGCDLTGKTSLAQALQWPLVRRYETSRRGQAYLDRCMQMHIGYDIWIRWWMAENIYSRILREQKSCNELEMYKFKLLSEAMGTVVIFLDIPLDLLILRYKRRGDTLSIEQLSKIHNLYREFFKTCKYLPPIFDIDHLDQALIKHHQLLEHSIKWLSFDVAGWGTLKTEKILFCGEVFSKAAYPFAFKTSKSCGKYFLECLKEAGLQPSDLHLMNLWHKHRTQGNWAGLLEFLKPRKIITLGREASAFLRINGVEFTEIPHPSYWKRFHYHNQEEYTNLIEGIVK